MNAVPEFVLDHWLVASPDAFRSLSDFWRGEAGNGSLLDWRLSNQLIEYVTLEAMEKRVGDLAKRPNSSIALVVDEADMSLIERLDVLSRRSVIHIVEWRASPLDVVLSMNAPDRALLAHLRGDHNAPPSDTSDSALIADLEGYIASLQRWENGCRSKDRAAFSEAYPAMSEKAVPWRQFVVGSAHKADAANDNWIALDMLAASTPADPGRPVTLDDPSNRPAQWRLTVSPVDGGPETLIIFRANPAAASSFIGYRVRVKASGNVIDLGEVDEEGRAEVLLPSPINMEGLSINWTGGE